MHSPDTQNTDTPPTYKLQPFPASANSRYIHCLSAIACRTNESPLPSGNPSGVVANGVVYLPKKSSQRSFLPTDRDRLEEGFSPDSKNPITHSSEGIKYKLECKVSRVFCTFSMLKLGYLLDGLRG